ncbi:MAG: hypothetical protein VX938_01625, partial [Myxococcota bacterium]|nr:hypothetical protein [Myxococcota bacterium]
MRGHDPKRKSLAGAAIFGLGLISILGGWMEAQRADTEPTREATQAAVDRVRAEFEPGDLVWVHPHWWEAPWAGLQGAGPGAEAPPFPALLKAPSPDPVRLLEGRRLWVLSGFGRDPSPALQIEGQPEPELTEQVAPGVQVRRYKLGTAARIQRLTENLERCSVERTRPNGDPVTCPLQGGRFVCGLDRWLDVDVRTRDVAGRDV